MSAEDIFGDEELVGDEYDDDGDDVGEDEELEALMAGDDDDDDDDIGDELVGAIARKTGHKLPPRVRALLGSALKKKSAKLKRVKAVAKLAMRRGKPIGVRPRPLNTSGEIPFGFFSDTEVAADATVTITLQPSVIFRPKRLLIPQSIAPAFTLRRIQIGQREQLINGNAVPCEAFSEESVNQGWKLPTIQIAQPMKMEFTNISGAAVYLRGCWLGIFADS